MWPCRRLSLYLDILGYLQITIRTYSYRLLVCVNMEATRCYNDIFMTTVYEFITESGNGFPCTLTSFNLLWRTEQNVWVD